MNVPTLFSMDAMVPSVIESPMEGTIMLRSAIRAALDWKPRAYAFGHAAQACGIAARRKLHTRRPV